MPGTRLRMPAADVVGPGGDGGQVVVTQVLAQFLSRGIVEVVPGNISDDPVTFATPRPRPGVRKQKEKTGQDRFDQT